LSKSPLAVNSICSQWYAADRLDVAAIHPLAPLPPRSHQGGFHRCLLQMRTLHIPPRTCIRSFSPCSLSPSSRTCCSTSWRRFLPLRGQHEIVRIFTSSRLFH
jgi:hypothetical protein